MNDAYRKQRTWARVAGLMYWVVLVVDLSGMQIHAGSIRHALMLAGSLCTVPLAFGLYFALRPVQATVAMVALSFRLVEAALGALSVSEGISRLHSLAHGVAGSMLLRLAEWDDRTNFAAFCFTVGSTCFFYLFVRSAYIPRVLAWWGLFASVLASLACSPHLVSPAFPAMTMYAWVPMLIAEITTGAWLLVRSVNVPCEMPAG